MFQFIGTLQGIEQVTVQLKDTPTKVYAIGAKLSLSKVPLEVLQNWVRIQLIEPCLVFGTGEYILMYTKIATYTPALVLLVALHWWSSFAEGVSK